MPKPLCSGCWSISTSCAISFCAVGLGYGGAPTFNAAATKQFFGETHFPINFPIINLNLLVSSFLPTLVSGISAAHGGYGAAVLVLVIMGAVSIPVALCIRQPKNNSKIEC